MPLHQALFVEPNPAGAKYALNRLGHMTDTLRQPLLSVAGETRAVIDDAMRHAGLLN
jgi:4-hydroxy-tetrahydrodipicolinate synthase